MLDDHAKFLRVCDVLDAAASMDGAFFFFTLRQTQTLVLKQVSYL